MSDKMDPKNNKVIINTSVNKHKKIKLFSPSTYYSSRLSQHLISSMIVTPEKEPTGAKICTQKLHGTIICKMPKIDHEGSDSTESDAFHDKKVTENIEKNESSSSYVVQQDADLIMKLSKYLSHLHFQSKVIKFAKYFFFKDDANMIKEKNKVKCYQLMNRISDTQLHFVTC